MLKALDWKAVLLQWKYNVKHFKFPQNIGISFETISIMSIVLTFPECHAVGIIQYVVFSDWLPPLSNIHWGFLYVRF